MSRNRLPVTFTVNDYIDSKDSRFLAVTIDVLHTGMNENGSIFTKEVVDANADSIKNTPILGYIAANPDGELDYQAHEWEIIKSENGDEYVYSGSAYGVIPESCNYRWIEKECSDGETREFFQVDGLMWRKFDDAVTILEKDGEKPQSMELELESIEGIEDENTGIFTFTGFKFDGCCLLSSSDERIQPAMIDSKAVVFSVPNIVQEIKDKLNEYNCLIEMKVGELMEEKTNREFSLDYMRQLEDEICGILKDFEMIEDSDGWSYPRYWLRDIDFVNNEAIIEDETNYHLYGVKFTNDESSGVFLDMENMRRKKITYVDYNENPVSTGNEDDPVVVIDESFEISEKFVETIKEHYSEELKSVREEYNIVSEQFNEIKPKYDEYVKQEQAANAKKLEEEKDKEFSKFDKILADVEEYTILKSKRDEYSLEEIHSQCAILFTEKNLDANFTKKDKVDNYMTSEVFEEESLVENNSRYGVLPTKK